MADGVREPEPRQRCRACGVEYTVPFYYCPECGDAGAGDAGEARALDAIRLDLEQWIGESPDALRYFLLERYMSRLGYRGWRIVVGERGLEKGRRIISAGNDSSLAGMLVWARSFVQRSEKGTPPEGS